MRTVSAWGLALVILLTPALCHAENYGVSNGGTTYWDWTFQEPRIGYRLDISEATSSGYSQGPEVGYKFGLVKDNFASGLEISLGILTGFPSISYPLYIGIFGSMRPAVYSPYRFDVGAGAENIIDSRTPENIIIQQAIRLKVDAEYIRPTGVSYGLSMGIRTFSENLGSITLNYTTITAVFYISFPEPKGLMD